MGFGDIYRSVTRRVDMERALLLVMILSSGFMIWESYNFSIESAARFPRLTAGAVLIGALLLFFQNYLPKPIQSFVGEEVEMLSAEEEVAERGEQSTPEREGQSVDEREETEENGEVESKPSISTVGRPIHDSLFTALSGIGYGVLGFAVGILWASPIFVFVYTLWFRRPWYQVIVLSILGFLIAYGFMSTLGVPMNEGEIFFEDGLGVL